jgi:hypothetical protein
MNLKSSQNSPIKTEDKPEAFGGDAVLPLRIFSSG